MEEEDFDPNLLEFVISAKNAFNATSRTPPTENRATVKTKPNIIEKHTPTIHPKKDQKDTKMKEQEEVKQETHSQPSIKSDQQKEAKTKVEEPSTKKEVLNVDDLLDILAGQKEPNQEQLEIMNKAEEEIGGIKADPHLHEYFDELSKKEVEVAKLYDQKCMLLMNEELNKLNIHVESYESLNSAIYIQCMNRIFSNYKSDKEFTRQVKKLEGPVFSTEIVSKHIMKLESLFELYVKDCKELKEEVKQQNEVVKEMKTMFERDPWFDYKHYMECVEKLNKLGDMPKL